MAMGMLSTTYLNRSQLEDQAENLERELNFACMFLRAQGICCFWDGLPVAQQQVEGESGAQAIETPFQVHHAAW